MIGFVGSDSAPEYLAIAGPTAVGKSAVAIEVAERLGGEIVIADSRQLYRGIDIATAKPTAEERARAPHHLVGVVDLGERYTAGDFAAHAGRAIEGIRARRRVPILCGGTGLYLAALAGALDAIEESVDPRARDDAAERLAGIPASERHAALADVDPETAARLPKADRQRVDRALEVWFLTGRPISELRTGGGTPRPHVAVNLVRPRVELAQRIERRLERMLAAGLEEEARALWEAGWAADAPGLDTIGIQEWWPRFEGTRSYEATVEEIRRATRRYAKRQATWFRNQGSYRSVPADAVDAVVDLWRPAA